MSDDETISRGSLGEPLLPHSIMVAVAIFINRPFYL